MYMDNTQFSYTQILGECKLQIARHGEANYWRGRALDEWQGGSVVVQDPGVGGIYATWQGRAVSGQRQR